MLENYLQYRQGMKQIKQDLSNSSSTYFCIDQSNTNETWLYIMIALIFLLSGLIFTAVSLLYRQRYKYPIAERSYLLSIMMCVCFYCLSVYYPIMYILVHNDQIDENTTNILKWIYIWSMYSLYISYFTRSLRIYAAFTNVFTCCINSQQLEDSIIRHYSTFNYNSPSFIIQLIANILRNELLLILMVCILSFLPCIPLIFEANAYAMPIQNYDYMKVPLGKNRDFVTQFVYLTVSFFFMLQLHLLRKVPKHYRFYQETLWNLSFSWLKAIVLFTINMILYDNEWCNYTYQINVFLDYFQYLCMIIVSVIPALIRSKYIAEKTPYPLLDKFYDFIEDEGDHNKMYCNISFIYYLNKKDQEINQQTNQQQRMNLNIYDFYKQYKTIQIELDPNQQNQKLIQLSQYYIFNPTDPKKLLTFPQEQAIHLQNFIIKYRQFELNEFNENEEFFGDLENIIGFCTQYLIQVFEEYKQSRAFVNLVRYYKQQQIYEINLSYFQLYHSN